MRVTRAVVIATPQERAHPLKAKGLHALASDVQQYLHIPLEAWAASTGLDSTVPVTSRALYGAKARRQESVMDIGSMGAIGCATSHILVLRSIPPNDEWTLVLESDAVLGALRGARLAQFLDKEGAAIHAHPDQPCMIMLNTDNTMSRSNKAVIAQFPGNGVFLFEDTFMGTRGILHRNKDAHAVAAALLPVHAQVDGAIGMLNALGKIPPVWGVHPSIVGMFNPQMTTIQTSCPLKPLLPYRNGPLMVIVLMPWVLFAVCAVLIIVKVARGAV